MLIILESPGKKVSVAKYTGAKVVASFGHIQDLDPKSLSVDLTTFDPTFFAIDTRQKEAIATIKREAKGEVVYIATDKDREGDAIAVFIYREIKSVAKKIYRAKFGEITKEAILKGIEDAVDFEHINWGSFNSFLGRRVGDRLVGFLLSPEAHNGTGWGNISKDDYMSVGRVQSITVRMIVDREREIKAFIPSTSYGIKGVASFKESPFKITCTNDKVSDKEAVENLLKTVNAEKTGKVIDVISTEGKRSPKAPYVTASILADASRRLNLSAEQTMFLLQKLYEGWGNGGIITYMRTDSTALSAEYVDKIGDFLKTNYKDHYNGPVKHKSKHSQAEAHEAIRPTMHPGEAIKLYDDIKSRLHSLGDQVAKKGADLFKMIVERTIECQMAPAIFNKTKVLINIKDLEFETNGSVLVSQGFLALKADSQDDDEDEVDENSLPHMSVGDIVNIESIELLESTTTPPKRFSEAAVIKELEKKEIGRPSTYASTLKILTHKNFATIEDKVLVPTKKSFSLVDFLNEKHQYIIDYDFTANMERFLDKVEEDGSDWKDFIRELYIKMGSPTGNQRSGGPTSKMVDAAKKIADEKGLTLTAEDLASFDKIKAFLEEHISKTPSDAQINLAKSIAAKIGKELTVELIEDKKLLSAWIDKNMKEASAIAGLSDKQKAIVEKYATDDIKAIVNSSNKKDYDKVKKWLDNFFKNQKK